MSNKPPESSRRNSQAVAKPGAPRAPSGPSEPAEPTTSTPVKPCVHRVEATQISKRFLFWIVFWVSLAPCGWFIATSYMGLQTILTALHTPPNSESVITSYLSGYADSPQPLASIVQAHLEFHVIQNRQARANSALATRTWLRFMSSVFGSVLVFIGAVFVLAKIETSAIGDMEAESSGVKFRIKSSSPGLIMVVIGAILMASANFAKQKITTTDGAVYYGALPNSPVISGPYMDEELMKERYEAYKEGKG